jgi:TRAP transporter TAXI family solute receptor
MSSKSKLAKLFMPSVICLAASFSTAAVSAEQTYVKIGTGGQTGVYYVAGQSICRLVNKKTDEHGIKCTAPSTGGSVANINGVRQGQLDFGVAQSDWQSYALTGTKHASFIDQGKFEDLRAIFGLYSEPLLLVQIQAWKLLMI